MFSNERFDKMKIYHGSNVEIPVPLIKTIGFIKISVSDFIVDYRHGICTEDALKTITYVNHYAL